MAFFETGETHVNYMDKSLRNIYPRNIARHLPKVPEIKFGSSKGHSFLDCLFIINWWWKGAKAGIDFDKSWSLPIITPCVCFNY